MTSAYHDGGQRVPPQRTGLLGEVAAPRSDGWLDAGWSVFRTRDVAAAREFSTRAFGGRSLTMTGTPGRFEFSVRSRHLPFFGVDLVRHSGHLETTRGPDDDAHVVEVMQGTLAVRSATTQLTVGPGEIVMTAGDEERTVTWNDVRLVSVRLDEPELRKFAAELAGIDLADHRFHLGRVTSEAHAQHWSAAVRYVVHGVLGNPAAASSPVAQYESFRVLASTALEAFHQVDLSRAGPHLAEASPAPATIRRAVDFIRANARRPIGLEDIAKAAGLSVRGTQAAFHRHLGMTPMAYLRGVRLAGVHRDLVEADPTAGEGVADIAARWGFLHQGHFAASYRARYGIPPSHTLAQ